MNTKETISTFWISYYEKETHSPMGSEKINTPAWREAKIIKDAKRRAARKGQYIIHS